MIKRLLVVSLVMTSLLSFLCCGEEMTPTPVGPSTMVTPPSIRITGVDDISNFGNAGDIKIFISKEGDHSSVSDYRVMVSQFTADIDESQALALDSDRYISNASISSEMLLNDELLDVEGMMIQALTDYKVYILIIDENENVLSSPSQRISFSNNNIVYSIANNVNGGSGGMDIDGEGNIYMADFGRTLNGPPGDKVFKISLSGVVNVFASGLLGASGNDFDKNGNLFQSNIQGASVSVIDSDGNVSSFSSAGLNAPVGIAIGDTSELYVCNCGSRSIQLIDAQGNSSSYVTSTLLNCPNGIDRDDQGNLYVANFSDGNIIKIDTSKNVTVLATLPGGNLGHLTIRNGALYVIARTANQIYKVSFDGTSEWLAGSGRRGGRDGSATNATFSLPNDLVFSHDGSKIYLNDVVPDSGSDIQPCRIRVLELAE